MSIPSTSINALKYLWSTKDDMIYDMEELIDGSIQCSIWNLADTFIYMIKHFKSLKCRSNTISNKIKDMGLITPLFIYLCIYLYISIYSSVYLFIYRYLFIYFLSDPKLNPLFKVTENLLINANSLLYNP